MSSVSTNDGVGTRHYVTYWLIYTVSQKTSKIVFVITSSNLKKGKAWILDIALLTGG